MCTKCVVLVYNWDVIYSLFITFKVVSYKSKCKILQRFNLEFLWMAYNCKKMLREGHFFVKDARAGRLLKGLIKHICKSDKYVYFLKLFFSYCAFQGLLVSGNWFQLGPGVNRSHCLHDTGPEANWLFHFSSYISYFIYMKERYNREAAITQLLRLK